MNLAMVRQIGQALRFTTLCGATCALKKLWLSFDEWNEVWYRARRGDASAAARKRRICWKRSITSKTLLAGGLLIFALWLLHVTGVS